LARIFHSGDFISSMERWPEAFCPRDVFPFSGFGLANRRRPIDGLTITAYFIKYARMNTGSPLHPTLWRTCRVLANRDRLRIFRLLAGKSGLTVSLVAERTQLSLPVASLYLRALEARSLLAVRRRGLRVSYRINNDPAGQLCGLIAVLRSALLRDAASSETIFKLATAFTHPRRVEIFRAVSAGPKHLTELLAATGISLRATIRHLGKLEARGFVACVNETYTASRPSNPVGRELAKLACA
jgi:DNA-binding transcriptional ArsR family regulator